MQKNTSKPRPRRNARGIRNKIRVTEIRIQVADGQAERIAELMEKKFHLPAALWLEDREVYSDDLEVVPQVLGRPLQGTVWLYLKDWRSIGLKMHHWLHTNGELLSVAVSESFIDAEYRLLVGGL